MRLAIRPLPLSYCVACLLAISACTASRTDREVARLRARLDSFAVTLTAVTKQLQTGSLPVHPESVTVGTRGAAALGRADAPVTIVEFTDYQCPFCARHAAITFQQLRANFIDRGIVRYVIRDLPLVVIHPYAFRGARAARCAGDQSSAAYWTYHDALFAEQEHLADSLFILIAKRMGLDSSRFAHCFSQEAFLKDVQADAASAQGLGFQSTPTFVVGGSSSADSIRGFVISGALPYDVFASAIQATLDGASQSSPNSTSSSH